MRFESHVKDRRCHCLFPWERRLVSGTLCAVTFLVALFLVLCLGTPAGAGSEDSQPTVNDRFDEMPVAEKKELQRKQGKFYRLSREEQEHLRNLHLDVSEDTRADHLRGVMERYARWLKTLPSGQRADLLDRPPKERIETIKNLMHQQHTSRLRGIVAHELADEDLAAIVKWMDDFVERHEQEILDSMPPTLKEKIVQVDDPKRRHLLIHVALRFRGRKDDVLRPDNEDIDRLKSQLSPKARQQLDKAKQDGHLAELAQRWMRAAIYSKRISLQVDRDELRRFYNEVASRDPKTREYLESLRPDRMLAELTRMYNAQRFEQFFGNDKPPLGGPGSGRRGRGHRGRSGDWRPPFGGPSPRSPQDNRNVSDPKKQPQ